MEITLTKLTLENFKGIKRFTLEPGTGCIVRGQNASGKTTLMDAFLWLLFNKDSQGKADFALKTLNDGEEIPNLDHAVEGIFAIDGQEITLKKVLKEKYTKKRGESRADFTGHTTDYFIDGVPVQKKEWDQQIADLINEETFKLLTSPTYFNSLHWEKRRSILLDVCGDISDADVIASDKALTALLDILNNKSLEDQKKIIAARRKEINQRLTEIPARIDELDKSLSNVSGHDVTAIQGQIRGLDEDIQAMKDDTALSHLRKQKAELQAQLSELYEEMGRARREASKEIDDKIDGLEGDLRSKRTLVRTLLEEAVRKESLIKQNEQSMERLRNNYSEVAGQKADVKNACPTCGQALPKDQIQGAIKKHNERQAQELADINAAGKRLKSDNTRLQEEIEAATKKGTANAGEIEKIETQIKELRAMPVNIPADYESKIDKVRAELEAVEKRISDNQPPDTTALEEKRKALQAQIAEVEAAHKTRARIEELKAEEKKLAADYEELERQLSLMEQFTVKKVSLLEEKINRKFAMAKWKLFDVQINQGISETCVVMVDGVPYSSLNDGHRILVGCDIISTLQKHYNIQAPIFVDHYEALSSPLQMNCQTIFLKVSNDKELTIANE